MKWKEKWHQTRWTYNGKTLRLHFMALCLYLCLWLPSASRKLIHIAHHFIDTDWQFKYMTHPLPEVKILHFAGFIFLWLQYILFWLHYSVQKTVFVLLLNGLTLIWKQRVNSICSPSTWLITVKHFYLVS